MLFTMWLNLWTTRLVLANLGVEDMGVYGVVGSIVNIFSVLTGGVTTAIQRFITFEMGHKSGNPNGVFCSSLNVIIVIAIIIFILLEVCGLWFLNNKVNIPSSSIDVTQWVFQLSVLTCLTNLISSPYNALIIAHEKMNAFALISILQVVLTCATAYSLAYLNNRLFYYALFMALIGFLARIICQIYCVSKFPESKYRFIIDKVQLKQLLKFTGISTASGILQIISSQGITLVINWTFGVAINAVYTISLQLKNSVLSFAQNIQKAIAPQITKTYASKELEIHKKLIYGGSKMEVFMIYFIMIPFLFRTDYIMQLWLDKVPEHAVVFVQCTVFLSLTYAAFEPIRSAVLATNKISKFMIVPEAVYLIVLPVSYMVGKVTENPSMMIISVVLLDVLVCILRIYFAIKVTVISFKDILTHLIYRSFFVAAFSSFFCYFLSKSIQYNISGLILLVTLNAIALCGIIYMVGLSKAERIQMNLIAKKVFKTFNRK